VKRKAAGEKIEALPRRRVRATSAGEIMTCKDPGGDRVDQGDARSRSAILPLFRDCSASGQNAFLVNQVLRAWGSIISPTGWKTHEPRLFFVNQQCPKSPNMRPAIMTTSTAVKPPAQR
jgi:hypothetical protein